ncbi:Exosome complex component RRP45 [Halocaridina rubra]|uniref:Exosome complex component RRP45 n=1 Tax=Halocaridina rubra TaxID=373956 RepID=A0AAN9AHH9_HALRR
MRETPLSTCERAAVLAAISRGVRLDNRGFLEVRDINLSFGKEYGSCTVTLGETRVLAQVTCEVVEPRPSRPNEGKLSISVRLSPMAAPHFESGRGNELMDELQMILDRNIKESRCLDLEALCIMAEESVWQLRVDVTVLNHAGNLGDACNLAAVAALRHFHRPDVSVEEDGRVTIHTFEESEPIATYMKKVPVCLTYAFFIIDENIHMLMDPSEKEERVMSGKLVVGLNPHGEITSLIFPGRVLLSKKDIMNCIKSAFKKAKFSAEMIQNLVDEDIVKRKSSVKVDGFAKNLISDTVYASHMVKKTIDKGQNFKFQVPRESDEENGSLNDEMDEDINDEESGDDNSDAKPNKSDILWRIQSIRQASTKDDDATHSMETDGESEEEEKKPKLTAQDLI